MARFSAGDIVLCEIAYSDGSGSKARPALILQHDTETDQYKVLPISKTPREGVQFFTLTSSMCQRPLAYSPSTVSLHQPLLIPEYLPSKWLNAVAEIWFDNICHEAGH